MREPDADQEEKQRAARRFMYICAQESQRVRHERLANPRIRQRLTRLLGTYTITEEGLITVIWPNDPAVSKLKEELKEEEIPFKQEGDTLTIAPDTEKFAQKIQDIIDECGDRAISPGTNQKTSRWRRPLSTLFRR